MIDYTNIHIAMEVLEDMARDFPILERPQSYTDEIWNTFAKKVRYTIEILQGKYNEQADKSINDLAKFDQRRETKPLPKEPNE